MITEQQIAAIETALVKQGWHLRRLGKETELTIIAGNLRVVTLVPLQRVDVWEPNGISVNLLDPIWRTALRAIDAVLTEGE